MRRNSGTSPVARAAGDKTDLRYVIADPEFLLVLRWLSPLVITAHAVLFP